MDHGLYLPQARKLGEKVGECWYHLSEASPYPESQRAQIGKGFDEIERIGAHEDYIEKADYIIFFDVYYGSRAKWLREKGHKVFSCGMAEELELDRVLFLETLTDLGLPVPYTYRAEGVTEAIDYLKGKKDKYLKTSRYRGDFETYHFISMRHAESWFDDLRYRLGSRAESIEILIQNPIESEVEVGYDGYNILGQYPKTSIIGYEIKDKCYVGKVVTSLPEPFQMMNDKFSNFHKERGCQGHYTNELRFTASGKAYYTDPTERVPSPPGEAMCETDEDYANTVLTIADGKVPTIKYKGKYIAQAVLQSPWHEKHELYVDFPKEIEPYVKLKNVTKRKGGCYCVVNGNGGYFGGVVGYADTVKDAIDLVTERAEQVIADEYKFDKGIFSEAQEAVARGKEQGIEF
jgi:hypothetical protein